VVLNPVRAGVVEKPEAWRWGSYQSTAGLKEGAGLSQHRLDSGAFQQQKNRSPETIPGVRARGDPSGVSVGWASGSSPAGRRGFC
jgi:hypothetical protein